MPEGDTIHRAAVTLRRVLANQKVMNFVSLGSDFGRREENLLKGTTITRVEARGKNLLIHFDDRWILHTHMRMNGSWHIYRKGERWRKPQHLARVVVEVADFIAVCFSAPVVRLLATRRAKHDLTLASLGPDVLQEDEFDVGEAIRRLSSNSDLEIAVALVRQSLISGIGNIFKSETLFLEKMNPFRRIQSLTTSDLRRIILRARQLMRDSLRAPDHSPTRFAKDLSTRLWVYRRSGKPCFVCGNRIQMRRQGDERRSTYFCPNCQSVGGPTVKD